MSTNQNARLDQVPLGMTISYEKIWYSKMDPVEIALKEFSRQVDPACASCPHKKVTKSKDMATMATVVKLSCSQRTCVKTPAAKFIYPGDANLSFCGSKSSRDLWVKKYQMTPFDPTNPCGEVFMDPLPINPLPEPIIEDLSEQMEGFGSFS